MKMSSSKAIRFASALFVLSIVGPLINSYYLFTIKAIRYFELIAMGLGFVSSLCIIVVALNKIKTLKLLIMTNIFIVAFLFLSFVLHMVAYFGFSASYGFYNLILAIIYLPIDFTLCIIFYLLTALLLCSWKNIRTLLGSHVRINDILRENDIAIQKRPTMSAQQLFLSSGVFCTVGILAWGLCMTNLNVSWTYAHLATIAAILFLLGVWLHLRFMFLLCFMVNLIYMLLFYKAQLQIGIGHLMTVEYITLKPFVFYFLGVAIITIASFIRVLETPTMNASSKVDVAGPAGVGGDAV